MDGLERIACQRCSVREERSRLPAGGLYECRSCGHRWREAWIYRYEVRDGKLTKVLSNG